MVSSKKVLTILCLYFNRFGFEDLHRKVLRLSFQTLVIILIFMTIAMGNKKHPLISFKTDKLPLLQMEQKVSPAAEIYHQKKILQSYTIGKSLVVSERKCLDEKSFFREINDSSFIKLKNC